MKKLVLVAIAWLALCAPAWAASLLSTTVTTAVSAATTAPLQLRASYVNMTLQGNFTYGSGGTSADAWVQTSIDGGATWTDVANFHFTTASARFIYNLSPLTAVTTQYIPTDGTLAVNTSKDGVFGSLWRVKYTTVGTYAGGTTLRVDAIVGATTGLTAR